MDGMGIDYDTRVVLEHGSGIVNECVGEPGRYDIRGEGKRKGDGWRYGCVLSGGLGMI